MSNQQELVIEGRWWVRKKDVSVTILFSILLNETGSIRDKAGMCLEKHEFSFGRDKFNWSNQVSVCVHYLHVL